MVYENKQGLILNKNGLKIKNDPNGPVGHESGFLPTDYTRYFSLFIAFYWTSNYVLTLYELCINYVLAMMTSSRRQLKALKRSIRSAAKAFSLSTGFFHF